MEITCTIASILNIQERLRRLWDDVRRSVRFEPQELGALAHMLGKWVLLGGAVGALAGLASALFLISLDWATRFREAHPAIILALPVAGVALGWFYQRYAGIAAQGNNLIIDEIHTHQTPISIPLRMAPMILLGTLITHLFGGSAGREGTALQMGASLADGLRRALGRWLNVDINRQDRRLMLMAGLSGGFGSVFGTPVAGFVFGMEVQQIGQMRYEGILPCLIAAVVGDWVTRALGVAHAHYPTIAATGIEPVLLLKVAAAGVLCGLTSLLFVELTHAIKFLSSGLYLRLLRPVLGGLMVLALTGLLGTQDYLGLSLPLIQRSVQGESIHALAFLLKLVFTAITLGSGFLGGEVTPLFVIGATLGHSLGRLLGVDPAWMAMLGFVAVFAGASNTPLACTLMGLELFGSGSPIYFMLICVIAYLCSGHRGIYITQRIQTAKSDRQDIAVGDTLQTHANKRRQPP